MVADLRLSAGLGTGYYPAGSGEALLRYVLFFWIMYRIYIFMQCAPILRFKIHILFLRAYA